MTDDLIGGDGPNDGRAHIRHIVDTASVVTEPERAPAPIPPRRGPGRPRKDRSAEATPDLPKRGPGRPRRPAGPDDDGGSRMRADEIVASVRPEVDRFRASDGLVYGTVMRHGHYETLPLAAKTFGDWLTRWAYQKTGNVPGPQAIGQAVRVLAEEEAPAGEVWLRVARRDDTIFIDLGDPDWSVVEITATGWQVVPMGRLPFVRRPGMMAMASPEPRDEPAFGDFARFFPLGSQAELQLVLSCLLFWLSGGTSGVYPVLVLNGEQGSGKSFLSRLICELVDPNHGALQGPPDQPDDFVVIAADAHLYALDNVSGFEPWIYDEICRLTAGQSRKSRTLFSNTEITATRVKRPVLLNGIPELVARPDFVERSVALRLPSIPDDKRRPEYEILADWQATKPFLMGALCDGLSSALARYRDVRESLSHLSRLADFIIWAEAAAPGLGFEPGEFCHAFAQNRRESSTASFEADSIAGSVARLVPSPGRMWSGSPAALLAALSDLVSEDVRKSRALWPQNVQSLGMRLDRIVPVLRSKGIAVQRTRGDARTIIIERLDAPDSGEAQPEGESA